MASARPKSSPPLLVGLLVAVGLLVGARAVQLASREFAQATARPAGDARQHSPPVAPGSAGGSTKEHASPWRNPPAEPGATSNTWGKLNTDKRRDANANVRRLPPDPELRAIIGAACPHALEIIDREGLPEPPTSTEPVRVAMRPSQPPIGSLRVAQNNGEWLTPPDEWFVPEDKAKQAVAAPDDQPEPSGEEAPSTDEPVFAPERSTDSAEEALQENEESGRQTNRQPALPEVIEGPDLGFTPAPESSSDASPAAEPPQAVETPAPPSSKPEPEPPASPDADRSAPRSLFDAPQPKTTPRQLPAPEPKRAPEPLQEATPEEPSEPEEVIVEPSPSDENAAEPRRIMRSARPTVEEAPSKPITPEPIFAAPVAAPPVDPHASGAPHSVPSKDGQASTDSKLSSIEAHRELFAKNCYPSAQQCGECHKKLYDEWRVSSHAYAFVSPMFQKFEQKITDLSQGTVGYFCYRCHSPVATSLGEHRATPLWDMPEVAREGVTCIACHRINERYTKANGERRVVPGDLYAPVYGGIGGDGVGKAIAKPDHYKVKTSPDQQGAGQPIHIEGRYFDQLGKAEFCTSCHQVAVHPGIKLEVVWEQYRQSPACKKGVTCQDCHMGLKPGEASGYEIGSIAEVGGKSVNEKRKHANHMFYGPNYSISHPGVFPHNKDAQRWNMQQWLKFNWRAGWGTDDFEDAVDDGKLVAHFPEEWKEADDRYDAREIIEDNLKALDKKNEKRREIMSEHMHVAGPYFHDQPRRGAPIRLYYDVTNLNEGHNVLTASLGAQPQLWANVVLIGPHGQRLWESGYTDSDGDLCDIHSRDVRTGRAPFDHQLFNLQTMFLITGATGTDREMPLPVNVDIDQLPFLRPGANPITTMNHPPFIRMESRSIAPLGTKRVHYKIPKELIQTPGRYRLSFRLRNRIEPIWFMRFCNATDEMVRMMNEGILDMHERSVEFYVR